MDVLEDEHILVVFLREHERQTSTKRPLARVSTRLESIWI
jgi:hypothetical protein